MGIRRYKKSVSFVFLSVIVGTLVFSRVLVAQSSPAQFQLQLINLAFDTASAIPADPHIKDRTKAQQEVVETLIRLDQPQRALRLIEQIEGWRQGAAYLRLADHYARNGESDKARSFVSAALRKASTIQDWHRGEIEAEAARIQGRIEGPKGKADFDEQMRKLDETVSKRGFDPVQGALWSYVYLFERHYEDAQRRALLMEKVRSSWDPVPPIIRINVLLKMADLALSKSDPRQALALVDEAQKVFEGSIWDAETGVPMMARLASFRFRAGDTEKARTHINAALARYEAERETIMGIFRPEALHPVAEAYQTMGDPTAALDVYRKALEEGADNPNARPRANNLTATCLSLASSSVSPDEGLWDRLRQVRQGLREPW